MSDVSASVSASLVNIVTGAKEYLSGYRPETKAVRYNYRDATSEMTFMIKVPNGRSRRFGDVEIPLQEGYQFKEMFSATDYNPVRNGWAIEDGCWKLKPSELPAHEQYIVRLEGAVNPELFDELVKLRAPEDPMNEDEVDKYWVHSAIKSPGIMKDIYDDLYVDDIDIGVQVGVQRCFSTALPSDVLDAFDRTHDLIRASNEGDRNRVHVAHRRREEARRRLSASQGEAADLIRSLASAENIKKFLTVEEPYRRRNINPDSSGSNVFPEKVSVDVTTDLTLDRKAADGELVFKKSDYTTYIEDETTSQLV